MALHLYKDDVKHQGERAESERELWLQSYNHICSFGLCISRILSVHYADQSVPGHKQTQTRSHIQMLSLSHTQTYTHRERDQESDVQIHTCVEYADTCNKKRGRLLIN